MLERGLGLGMEAEDLWFDPLFLVVKGMQDKQMEVLEAVSYTHLDVYKRQLTAFLATML